VLHNSFNALISKDIIFQMRWFHPHFFEMAKRIEEALRSVAIERFMTCWNRFGGRFHQDMKRSSLRAKCLVASEENIMKEVLRDIHRYWFGELNSPGDHLPNIGELWFRQSDVTDRHIRATYEPFIHEAAGKEWDLGTLSRQESVALVVLFDQFPRNIFRDSRLQFAFDAKAREIAKALTSGGLDRFFPIERDLLSLPFQHHEDEASQDLSVSMAADLAVNGPENMRAMHRTLLDFACKHRDLIRKFGRYPHRNIYLGRTSTPEELAFIEEHGRGY
jgi:uncharacterized protein (DUF924 family)